MQLQIETPSRRQLVTVGIILGLFVLLLAFRGLIAQLGTLLLGAVMLCFIATPLSRIFEGRLSRPAAALAALLCIATAAVGLLWLLVPSVYRQLTALLQALPDSAIRLAGWAGGVRQWLQARMPAFTLPEIDVAGLLGPFSGLVTGLLSGVLQYLLLISLLVLFRKPGIAGLFYIIRWLLSAILFGRVTPVGILLCAVSVVVIETVLRISGFYRKQEISFRFGIFLSLLIGICDAGITFINMQQLMLFYRMYYADWFVGLYMVINGLLYSTIGSFLGFKMGSRLKQVMGS